MSTNNIVHESGKLHVTGEAIYVDDMNINDQLLIGKIFRSPIAHGKIKSVDFSEAEKIEGVHKIISHKDVPGENQIGPIIHDEIALAVDKVEFIGQAILLIAAENEEIAEKAASLINIEFEELDPIITIDEAIEKGELLQPERKIEYGNIEQGFNDSDHVINSTLNVGGQEHWYLETHSSIAVPGEGDEMTVYSSSQNPTETQILVAENLGVSSIDVKVIMRRMGGAFGGKETQANHYAVWASLLAYHTKRPVKIRLFRDDDQKYTGKRHPFFIEYKAGFTNDGKIKAVDVILNSNGGCATDLSMSILERAMLHAENSYFIPNIKIIGRAWKTNLPSNTAYRGFGGPQGIAYIETIIDKIARELKIDSATIREKNFYETKNNNVAPYGQIIKDNQLQNIYNQIIEKSDYFAKRKAINKFNAENKYVKKGLALTPVKFGISFTTSFLNQAGALVNIYKDGTVLVNHGGTEMGQGLHTKIQQVAAIELGIDLDKIKVTATDTSKVPNTSPTAASSGTDMNGMAVKNAIDKLKERIVEKVACYFSNSCGSPHSDEADIIFEDNYIIDSKQPERKMLFAEAVNFVYMQRTSLSATGFYKTPGVEFDRDLGKGNPFYYFAYGISVSEVEVDTLTGYVKPIRTDIIHDVGKSINSNIDIGQIEGAYIQGLGWVTTEEMKYDKKGNLLNHSPDTYKIPGVNDIPEIFNVELLKDADYEPTIHKSKAVGEPPFMLAFSNWLAIKDAISAVGNHEIEPEFELPATNEKILLSIEKIRQKIK
jgi:xanthine dehydrogenase large subunit